MKTMNTSSTPFFWDARIALSGRCIKHSNGIHGDHQWPTTSLAGCLAVGALAGAHRRESTWRSPTTYKGMSENVGYIPNDS